jgi:hypothetical protein
MRHRRPTRLQQFGDWVKNAPAWQPAVAALLLAVATLTGTVAVLRAGFSVQPGPGSSRPLSSPEPTYTTPPAETFPPFRFRLPSHPPEWARQIPPPPPPPPVVVVPTHHRHRSPTHTPHPSHSPSPPPPPSRLTHPARSRLTHPARSRLTHPARPHRRLPRPAAVHPARLAGLLGECPDLPGASCDGLDPELWFTPSAGLTGRASGPAMTRSRSLRCLRAPLASSPLTCGSILSQVASGTDSTWADTFRGLVGSPAFRPSSGEAVSL